MEFELLVDRYQLHDPIDRDWLTTTYRGQDIRTDRVVAVNVLREDFAADPKFVRRFQRMAEIQRGLQHPNIVQVYDYGQDNSIYYTVTEFVEGTDLRRYLRSRGVLDASTAISIAHDIALGLGAAHRHGIVHRDVKPQNVLIGIDGSIKLSDFGIVSMYKDALDDKGIITSSLTGGTVQYYAPEQAQGEIVTPAADVYGLGIVMYEMLTGHPPFNADSLVLVAMQHIQDVPTPPSQLNPYIPKTLEEIIMRCLEKQPELRFQDGSKLARALERII
jgi:serine/threonine protein kinase